MPGPLAKLFASAALAALVPLARADTPAQSAADLRPSVTVLEVEVTAPGEETDPSTLTDVVAAAVDEAGWVKLVPARDPAAPAGEPLVPAGCAADPGCVARLPAMLGADHVIVVSVAREGDRFLLAGRMLDARRGETLARASTEVRTAAELTPALREVGRGLVAAWRDQLPAPERERIVSGGAVRRRPSAVGFEAGPVLGYAPRASAPDRTSVGAEVALTLALGGGYSGSLAAILGGDVGARLALWRSLFAVGRLSVAAGLRAAVWPGVTLASGGAALRAELARGERWTLFGVTAVERSVGRIAGAPLSIEGGFGLGARF